MKRSFVLTPESETDAIEIWEHIADHDSEKAADHCNLYNAVDA